MYIYIYIHISLSLSLSFDLGVPLSEAFCPSFAHSASRCCNTVALAPKQKPGRQSSAKPLPLNKCLY